MKQSRSSEIHWLSQFLTQITQWASSLLDDGAVKATAAFGGVPYGVRG